MKLSEKVPFIFLHTVSSLHEVKIFNSGSKKYSDTDAAAAGAAAGAAAAVFFILGVAAWGPWAQANPGMKNTAAAAPAAAPAAAASVSEKFVVDPE